MSDFTRPISLNITNKCDFQYLYIKYKMKLKKLAEDIVKEYVNENSNNEYRQALKDVSILIPRISHEIIHKKGLEHTEENIIKLNSEIKQKVESGDDDILDRMWDLAGSAVLKHAINVITHYHKNN